jgi:hypothetical protein
MYLTTSSDGIKARDHSDKEAKRKFDENYDTIFKGPKVNLATPEEDQESGD